MELEEIVVNEVSQTEKDKYCLISFRCGNSKENKRKKKNVSENRLVVARSYSWRVGTIGR